MDVLESYVRFIQEVEGLKSTLRTAWTASGRQESTAEHSWRLALMAGLFLHEFPALDGHKVLVMCLIHDLAELDVGDISAALRTDEKSKHEAERRALERIVRPLPEPLKREIRELWQQYNDNATGEAKLVKALDKAETILQHNQGRNPEDFDYAFNLEYGIQYFKGPVLKELRRMIDEDTRVRVGEFKGQEDQG
ncbi:HD domain-containing protein [Gehongia tenuis]|uniref:5'-deoxynucleotidase n=1 Tax=Gehongia tenuis TaxID=2763655 RepID=A0A926D2S7_9FIRM|nr:HD domain-containing protein [Gehongia tenuis]MBC8531355.1 HD domain-containing protein [Gehongia tenuis]